MSAWNLRWATKSLREAAAELTLVLAIFKFDRMEWAIEKCTEIGVARIVPVIARRTDTHLAAAAGKRHERWGAHCSASRRAIASRGSAGDFGADQVERAGQWRNFVPTADASEAAVVVAIVLTDSELRHDCLAPRDGSTTTSCGRFASWDGLRLVGTTICDGDGGMVGRDSGWATASVGDTILRAETAALSARAIALATAYAS